MPSPADTLRHKVTDLTVWRRGDQRAPHKPLLLLWALGRVARGQERLADYAELEEPLQDLLERFGPPRKAHHPEYPFWHLQTDGLWEVRTEGDLVVREGGSPTKGELEGRNARGGLPEEFHDLLSANPDLVAELAERTLEGHFPGSLHDDILEAVGLSPEPFTDRRRPRDPQFRHAVIRAYEHRCAICGFDLRLEHRLLALEAAHIKWHQAGGPDEVPNGLALCSLHHKSLDSGAIGFTDDLRLVVSAELHGQNWFEEWFLAFAGEPLRAPQDQADRPDPAFLDWHRREVFRPPSRVR